MRSTIKLIVLIAALFALREMNHSALGEPTPAKSQKEAGARERELDAMIDALANRANKAPRIMGNAPRNPVFFDEEYDEKEQVRVFRAAEALKKGDGNELWPRLVAHMTDDRYALTWEIGEGINRNMTVGKLCRLIARWDLDLAFQRLSPTMVDDEGFGGHPIHLVTGPNFSTDELFLEWCEKRKGKQLYEMQIDILEWTLTEPRALHRLSAAQTDVYTGKVKVEIERLKKTREPVIELKKLRLGGYYTILSEDRIKAYRERR